MTQIILPSNSSIDSQKLYCYTNKSEKTIISRLNGLEERHCERVIFPGERFLFKANDNCELEITQQTNIEFIKNTIPCLKLK